MKLSKLVVLVVLTHVVVIGTVFLVQGCRTRGVTTVEPPPPPVLPPKPVEEAPVPSPGLITPPPVGPAPAVAAPVEGPTYVVQPGDNLGKIAARAGVSVREIVALNRISDPNKIRVGQKLVLPEYARPISAAPKTETPAAKPKPKPAKIPEGATVHVVAPGDNLTKIAKKYGVKISDLRAANNLSGDMIRVGQKLVIPGASAKKPAAESKVSGSTGEATPSAMPAPSPVKLSEEPALAPPPETSALPAETSALPLETAAPSSSTSPSAPEPIVYRALPQDTVESVAKMYLVDVNELMALNNFKDPKQPLTPGQKVLIPPLPPAQ